MVRCSYIIAFAHHSSPHLNFTMRICFPSLFIVQASGSEDEQWNPSSRYEEAIDFINLHYILSKRTDTPFWREASADHRMTPRIKEYLARWEQKPPSRLDFVDQIQLFSHINYEFILYGMDWAPEKLRNPPPQIGPPDVSRIAKLAVDMRKHMKPHNALLKEMAPR